MRIAVRFFLLSLQRKSSVFNISLFFNQPNPPRCELRWVFHVLFRIWLFSGVLSAFLMSGGITYHPDGESALKRKFAENNGKMKKSEKILLKLLEIKK